MPAGYDLNWSGEFESQRRAEARLAMMIPLRFLPICFVLFFMFRSVKWTLIILVNVLLARIGGVLALFLTGTNFSVSSGIGFSLFSGFPFRPACCFCPISTRCGRRGSRFGRRFLRGSCRTLRPIIMTALVATLACCRRGLLSWYRFGFTKPLAIVVVGGFIADLVMAFVILPTFYDWFAIPKDILK